MEVRLPIYARGSDIIKALVGAGTFNEKNGREWTARQDVVSARYESGSVNLVPEKIQVVITAKRAIQRRFLFWKYSTLEWVNLYFDIEPIAPDTSYTEIQLFPRYASSEWDSPEVVQVSSASFLIVRPILENILMRFYDNLRSSSVA